MTTTDHTPADNQPRSRSARDDLEAMIRTDAGSMTVWSPAEALAALDAYRAEVEQALRDRDKYVAVPRWEYELMERQRERAALAEAEVGRLRGERDALAKRVDTLTAVAQGNKRHVQHMYAELVEVQRERKTLRARVAELEAERATHRAAVLREAADAVEALPQDYECDPGRGDAADLLRRMADTAPAGAEDGQQ